MVAKICTIYLAIRVIVPNVENVANSLSGLHFIPNKTNVESIIGDMIIVTITFFSFA